MLASFSSFYLLLLVFHYYYFVFNRFFGNWLVSTDQGMGDGLWMDLVVGFKSNIGWSFRAGEVFGLGALGFVLVVVDDAVMLERFLRTQ